MLCSFVDMCSVSEEPSTLKMEAADASKMLVPVYRITLCHIPEDNTISVIVSGNMANLCWRLVVMVHLPVLTDRLY